MTSTGKVERGSTIIIVDKLRKAAGQYDLAIGEEDVSRLLMRAAELMEIQADMIDLQNEILLEVLDD